MSQPSAVLITAYVRPANLKRLLDFLSTTNRRIYVSLDVPRKANEKLLELSESCKNLLEEYRDVITRTKVADANLGCYRGVTEGISWAFEYEENLIIIEEDIVISNAFLEFADWALIFFQKNPRVGSITGTNLVPKSEISEPQNSFRLSTYPSSWGWATWKDRWSNYLEDSSTFPSNRIYIGALQNRKSTSRYWSKIFDEVAIGEIDSWAYRWLYSNLIRERLAVTPNENLVINTGFDELATHTRDTHLPWWLPTKIVQQFEFEEHLSDLSPDFLADSWMEVNHFRTKPFQQIRRNIYEKFPSILRLRKSIPDLRKNLHGGHNVKHF